MPCPFAKNTRGPNPHATRRVATIVSHLANSRVQNSVDIGDVLVPPSFDHLPASTEQVLDDSGNGIDNCPGPAENAEAYNSDNHHYLTSLHEQHGDIFATKRDGKVVLFARSPEAVRRVLDSDSFGKTWDSADKSGETNVDYVNNLIQPFMKGSVFNMHGEENFKRRALLRPLFTGLKPFAPLIAKTTAAELSQWNDGVVDIQDLSHDLLRMNILALMCGDYAEHMHHCLPACHEVMDYFTMRYSQPCHDQEIGERDNIMMQQLNDAALCVVLDMRHRVETATTEPTRAVSISLLYLMMQNDLSDLEMAATFVNVMIAAGEAPASALAQTLEELALNQPVRERLMEEADAAISGGLEHNMGDLDFTEAVMTEGLRLFAPATLVSRSAMVDTTLDGVEVPKGTAVGICVHSVHHDPKQWEEPNTFNPDRKNLDYESRNGFVAFSNGQRGCPGKHLALMCCKISLAMIVNQFDLAVVPNQPRSQECAKVRKFVEWSVNGIPLQLIKR